MPWPHVYCVPVAEGLYEYQLCKTHITTIKRVMVKCMFMIATLNVVEGIYDSNRPFNCLRSYSFNQKIIRTRHRHRNLRQVDFLRPLSPGRRSMIREQQPQNEQLQRLDAQAPAQKQAD